MAIRGAGTDADEDTAPTANSQAGNYSWDDYQASIIIYNGTGQDMSVLLHGDADSEAGTDAYTFVIPTTKTANVSVLTIKLSVWYAASATITNQGTASATISIKGWPEAE